MPKRSYEQFSSPKMSLSKLNTTSISITDLPVDVLCLVFKRLPLSEVLRNQALVCQAFYDAHLQHCRSSVKHLTLFGHYMLKTGYLQSVVEPQKEAFRKQVLFEYARETNGGNCSSTPTINPSTSHLKLVVGLEESAYAAIGTKFQSVTSLELFQPALERHYRPITAMINAWGGGEEKKKKKVTGGDNSTNQLTELKIFFNKEIYRPDGLHIKRGNSSCCLAYLLAEALTPAQAPALRRLTIVPGNWRVACQNSGNHNSYRGQLLGKIDLSQVTAINAIDFAVIDLPEQRWGRRLSSLQELTIETSNDPTEIFSWATAAVAAATADVLGRLTGLTVIVTYDGMDSLKALPPGLAVNLRRLSLQHVQWSLTEVVQQVVLPLTTTTTTTTTTTSHRTVEGVNDRLEELRVDFISSGGLISLAKKAVVDSGSLRARFPALTTLHLVKSTLLHRADEMSALSALFPNLAHLRLDQNHRADIAHYSRGNVYYGDQNCPQCVQHVLGAFREPLNRGAQAAGGDHLDLETAADVQLLPSSTAPACKAALVRRAVAAWPQLTSITLQIDDFFRAAHRSDWEANECRTGVSRLQYLYRCECLFLRDPLTGEQVQKEDLNWTVKEVPY